MFHCLREKLSEIEIVVKMLQNHCKTRRPLQLYCNHIKEEKERERRRKSKKSFFLILKECMRDSFVGATGF